jgi:hypothetical protein
VTGRPDDQVGTWFAPHRRQKRAVADRGKPQFTHACTPESARLRTSRLEAAHMASTPMTAARGRFAGQDGASGHCGSAAGDIAADGIAGHCGSAAGDLAADGMTAIGMAAGGTAAGGTACGKTAGG